MTKKKDFPVWVGKKGRGRPSLFELKVSTSVSKEFVKNKPIFQKCLNDAMIFGTGFVEIANAKV